MKPSLAVCALLGVLSLPAQGAAVLFSVGNSDVPGITPTVDRFRAALGANNGVGGTHPGGRREINWDGVPPAFRNPHPGDFFNSNSPRGAVFATPGTGFAVSGDGAAADFDDITLGFSGAAEFTTFSAPRLFTAVGSNITDLSFFIPGTALPATVNAFGAVFTDVEFANTTLIEYFGIDGSPLFTGSVIGSGSDTSETLSFLGVLFDAGERIARVRITAGTTGIGPLSGTGSDDAVVMDDFIYGEPQPVALPATLVLLVSGWAGLGARRRARA